MRDFPSARARADGGGGESGRNSPGAAASDAELPSPDKGGKWVSRTLSPSPRQRRARAPSKTPRACRRCAPRGADPRGGVSDGAWRSGEERKVIGR
eukprot:129652-Pyramimonas_sp.AAC.1